MAVAKVMKRFLAWLVAKFFPPKPIKELEVKEEADPYRPTPPAEEEHSIDCKGCEWLDHYGRWQPPEVVLAAGIPFSCLSKQWGKTKAELIEMAKRYGLKVIEEA